MQPKRTVRQAIAKPAAKKAVILKLKAENRKLRRLLARAGQMLKAKAKKGGRRTFTAPKTFGFGPIGAGPIGRRHSGPPSPAALKKIRKQLAAMKGGGGLPFLHTGKGAGRAPWMQLSRRTA